MTDKFDQVLGELDKLAQQTTYLNKRMDSLESQRRAAIRKGERPAIRRDSALPPEVMEMQRISELKEEIARAERDLHFSMTKAAPVSIGEEQQRAEVQSRFDSVYSLVGRQAPRPLPMERAAGYRARLLSDLKRYDPELKDVKSFRELPEQVVDAFEAQIFDSCKKTSAIAMDIPYGKEMKRVRADERSGQKITEFFRSDGGTFIRDMKPPRRWVRKILSPEDQLLRRLASARGDGF